MSLRKFALESALSRRPGSVRVQSLDDVAENFGSYVFSAREMKKYLTKPIYENVQAAMEGKGTILPEYADTIAVAMKEWAVSLGATHFTHWFLPLSGMSAEKHDSFIEWSGPGEVMEKFSGKQLIQGEPDASSFPSGGLRNTFEARGYTGWDPTSPAFVWKAGDGITLCIPSVFFSWTGDVLDSKIPLLRSERKLGGAVLRLLKLTGLKAEKVNVTIGLEQEYFVIDRALYHARPDLLMCGRTLFGAPSPKGQQLQDHYFGAVKDRILSFMHDFECQALKLGIPLKTRHNEVAPAQHEVASAVEFAAQAVDHNIQLMELMRKVAIHHDLAVLLHEKPFDELNGSGKHCNWSIATDTGINLLDPSDVPENNLHFLVLLTAIVHGVFEHSQLLRSSIGTAANDWRLGGHEAPPAIVSIFLGDQLEDLLDSLEKKGTPNSKKIREKYDLGLSVIPELHKDYTDRNRTSPFAFTGNKFEYRAVGASQNPALPITVLNAIVAQSLHAILNEVEKELPKSGKVDKETVVKAVLPVLCKYLKKSRDIRFNGDNYSAEWVKEAKKRKLPLVQKSIRAIEVLKERKTEQVFDGILAKHELQSRWEIFSENYAHTIHIEAALMLELFRTQILPAALKHHQLAAQSLETSKQLLKKHGREKSSALRILSDEIEKGYSLVSDLEEIVNKASAKSDTGKKAKSYCDDVLPLCSKLRKVVDRLESLVADDLWPLPKYREILFLV